MIFKYNKITLIWKIYQMTPFIYNSTSKIENSGTKFPLIFTYDSTDDNNRQIVSSRLRNENNEILHNKHIHKTKLAIPKTFTLSNKAKLFYDESDDDGTIPAIISNGQHR